MLAKSSHTSQHSTARQRRRVEPGRAPGTIVVDPNARRPRVRMMAYGPQTCVEREDVTLDEVRAQRGKLPVVWLDIDGLGDAELLRAVAEMFGLHPLAMEDVVNGHQRPHAYEYGEHLFIVTHMVRCRESLEKEQLNMFLGDDFVVTFQEVPGDCLDPVRHRIRNGIGKVRNTGPDYLAYALLDVIIDHYFPVLEHYGDLLEEMEETIMVRQSPKGLGRLVALRGELIQLRRSIWPLRDVCMSLMREELTRIQPETRVYLSDCLDHSIRLIDIAENSRELAANLMEVHLAVSGQRLNEIMKVLTIISTIFMPLSFIAGVYGMNFDTDSPWNMPELRWAFGYEFALGLMAVVAAALVIFFQRRGWFSLDELRSEGRHPGARLR
jgi:magnesium transporter